MKKFLSLLLSTMFILVLAGCGNTSDTSDTQTQAPQMQSLQEQSAQTQAPQIQSLQEQSAQTQSHADSGTAGMPADQSNHIPVAYFSWSGNTRQIAGMIAGKTGGELFEISPKTPYTKDYNELLNQAQQEQRNNARPSLAASVSGWEQYDTIFVGYPNWWSDAPMIILSFLESHDCSGKTIIPFCTSGGGGLGRSVSSIRASVPGAVVTDGFHIDGSRAGSAQSAVDSWIDGLGISK